MAGKTHVLWASKGPIAAGDLDTLKVRAEKMVTAIVGATEYRWDQVEKVEDDDPENRLSLYRKNTSASTWINLPYFIDEVPVVAPKKKAGA
jgi:hypothetical protein